MGKNDDNHKSCAYCKKTLLGTKVTNRKYYYDINYGITLKFHKHCFAKIKTYARKKGICISEAIRIAWMFVGFKK